MVSHRAVQTVLGVALAATGHAVVESTLTERLTKWLLHCRYSPRRTRYKDRIREYMIASARRLRSLTKMELKQLESVMSSIGGVLGTLADRVEDIRYPLPDLALSEANAESLNTILEFCHLQRPVAFWWAFPFWQQAFAKKIAEGAYGEIYSTEQLTGTDTILKIVAVNGFHPKTRIYNTTFRQEVTEVVSAVYLSELNNQIDFRAPNFPKVYRICLVRGPFPKPVMKTWIEFAKNEEKRGDVCESPRPDSYEPNQLFVTFEMSSCGMDLTKLRINDPVACVIWICQIISALAVAESAHKFEHRDLHLGNVLVKETNERTLEYVIRGTKFKVMTLNHHVYIIDYSMSRITAKGKVYFSPMDSSVYSDCTCEQNSQWKDHMYIYKCEDKACKGNWSQYIPITNLFWIRHLIENFLICMKEELKIECLSQESCTALIMLQTWRNSLISCDSATTFLSNVLFNGCPYVISPKQSQ